MQAVKLHQKATPSSRLPLECFKRPFCATSWTPTQSASRLVGNKAPAALPSNLNPVAAGQWLSQPPAGLVRVATHTTSLLHGLSCPVHVQDTGVLGACATKDSTSGRNALLWELPDLQQDEMPSAAFDTRV